MRTLMDRWFYRLHRAEEEGMVSFEDAFGRAPEDAFSRSNMFDGPDEDEDGDDDAGADSSDADDEGGAAAADDADSADADGDDQGGDEGEGDGALAEWEVEMQRRFAPGTFTEEGWKAYRNMEILVSQRTGEADPGSAAPAAPAEAPAPVPLLGSVAEIQTEEQLYSEAQAKPREVAMWAIDNQERLSQEQYENVMNIWFASNPHQYQMFWRQVDAEGLMGVVQERFQHETAQQMENARGEGLKAALEENPLIDQYREPLGKYMMANPHLNQWVDGLRTKAEVKSAVEAIFYMMAGPELGRQVLEQKAAAEAARLEAEATAAANGTQAADAAAAARTPRRSAQPRSAIPAQQLSDEDYAKGIQDKILNMGVSKR